MNKFERPLSTYESAHNAIEKIIKTAERDFRFGGDENKDGDLEYGVVDFVLMRTLIEEAAMDLNTETKEALTLQINTIESAGGSLSEDMFTDLLTEVKKILLENEESVSMRDDITRTLEEERLLTLEDLTTFVDSKIISSEFGSVSRSNWGNALNSYRNGDKAGIVALLQSESRESHSTDKEAIDRFLSVLI